MDSSSSTVLPQKGIPKIKQLKGEIDDLRRWVEKEIKSRGKKGIWKELQTIGPLKGIKQQNAQGDWVCPGTPNQPAVRKIQTVRRALKTKFGTGQSPS